MTSDSFIVLIGPDYLSDVAIDSLSKTLPRWRGWSRHAIRTAAFREAIYEFPDVAPKFLGTIMQGIPGHNPVPGSADANQKTGSSYPKDELERKVRDVLIPALGSFDMLLGRVDNIIR